MGTSTKIAWCDHTFNPWWGCTKVSPGCAHCYAEALDARYGGAHWGVGQPRRRTSDANWRLPLRWQRAAHPGTRPRVFCASMADWLDPEVPVDWLADLLDLIDATPHLRWMLLTKRPGRWQERMAKVRRDFPFAFGAGWVAAEWLAGSPPANVAVGATVEDQRRAEERIPALLAIPARRRFLSCEPLLSPVDLRHPDDDEIDVGSGVDGSGIHQVIIGGESGPDARPFDVLWAEGIIDQCQNAGVPVWVKQLGSRPLLGDVGDPHGWPTSAGPVDWETGAIRLRDRAGADPSEWPEHLRVQEEMR